MVLEGVGGEGMSSWCHEGKWVEKVGGEGMSSSMKGVGGKGMSSMKGVGGEGMSSSMKGRSGVVGSEGTTSGEAVVCCIVKSL